MTQMSNQLMTILNTITKNSTAESVVAIHPELSSAIIELTTYIEDYQQYSKSLDVLIARIKEINHEI